MPQYPVYPQTEAQDVSGPAIDIQASRVVFSIGRSVGRLILRRASAIAASSSTTTPGVVLVEHVHAAMRELLSAALVAEIEEFWDGEKAAERAEAPRRPLSA